jgi:hypothetical protein
MVALDTAGTRHSTKESVQETAWSCLLVFATSLRCWAKDWSRGDVPGAAERMIASINRNRAPTLAVFGRGRVKEEAGSEHLIAILAPPSVSDMKRRDILRSYCHVDFLIAVAAELNLTGPCCCGPLKLKLFMHGNLSSTFYGIAVLL